MLTVRVCAAHMGGFLGPKFLIPRLVLSKFSFRRFESMSYENVSLFPDETIVLIGQL